VKEKSQVKVIKKSNFLQQHLKNFKEQHSGTQEDADKAKKLTIASTQQK
jgi:hypothetical protein